MANNQNLTPFKPGQVHNPNGRPKGRRSISTYLKMFVEGDLSNIPNEKLREQLTAQGFDCISAALAFKKLSLALSQTVKPDTSLRAIDSIEDRLEGKATQKTELTGKDGSTLAISNVVEYEESLKGMTVEELKKHNELLESADKIIAESQQRNSEQQA